MPGSIGAVPAKYRSDDGQSGSYISIVNFLFADTAEADEFAAGLLLAPNGFNVTSDLTQM